MQIAGKLVNEGDKLYHINLRKFVRVHRVEDAYATYLEEAINMFGKKHEIHFKEDGYINGAKTLYWHKPIELNLPISNIDKIQEFIDTNLKFLTEGIE